MDLRGACSVVLYAPFIACSVACFHTAMNFTPVVTGRGHCALQAKYPMDLYRYLGARRTHCSIRGEKRRGRGGDVLIGYAANMHGNYVMQVSCSTCVIVTQVHIRRHCALRRTRAFFEVCVAEGFSGWWHCFRLRHSWPVRQIAGLRLTICSKMAGTKGP